MPLSLVKTFALALLVQATLATAIYSEDNIPTIDLNESAGYPLHKLPWQFYWKQFLSSADFADRDVKPDLILQPVTIWNGQKVRGETLGSFGYATYRLKLKIDAHGKRIALRLPAPLTSYRVFVNGELLGEAGKVSSQPEDYKPLRRSALVFFTPVADEIEIIIHVANYLVYKGGLRGGIELGYAPGMQAYGMRYLAIDLFCIGLIFAIMLYHLLIFVLTRKESSTLVFALVAFNYFLLAFFFGEQSITLFLPDIALPTHTRLASCFAYVLPPLVMEFTGRLYSGILSRRVTNLFWIVAAIFCALVILPPLYPSQYNVFYFGVVGGVSGLICMHAALAAVRAKRPGSRLLASGLLFLIALTIYAVYLFATHAVAGSFLSIGFAMFALFQSGSLAHAHAALAAHNADMLNRLERSRTALDNQRKQIEANLHDSLGGNLTDIKLGLEAIVRQARSSGLLKDIRRIDHRVAGTIASLRTELLFLEDMQLAMKDFVAGINLILLRRYQMVKKPVDIQVAPETRELSKRLELSGFLDEEVRPELCMIVQELCNNSLKYTAGAAKWEIIATDQSLRISVKGKSRHDRRKKGLGKETLRSRAEKISARFDESVHQGFYEASITLP